MIEEIQNGYENRRCPEGQEGRTFEEDANRTVGKGQDCEAGNDESHAVGAEVEGPLSSIVSTSIDVLRCEILGLEKLVRCLGGHFPYAVLQLRGAERVIVTGLGKSGHVAQKMAATLSSTGTPAHYLHPVEAGHGDLGIIAAKDVVLIFSNSGDSQELCHIITHCKRFSIPIIGVTAKEASLVGRASDLLLLLPSVDEACPLGVVPTTSCIMQMAMGDCLAMSLLKLRGFTLDDFHALHPSGKLGMQLKQIDELMHRDMPLIGPQERMKDAILKISTYPFGCVGVVDDDGLLIGIITDGDLRRHLDEESLLQWLVCSVMTPGPRMVPPDMTAARALELMNYHEITALFVTDRSNKPLGVVHIHDLLRAGVA